MNTCLQCILLFKLQQCLILWPFFHSKPILQNGKQWSGFQTVHRMVTGCSINFANQAETSSYRGPNDPGFVIKAHHAETLPIIQFWGLSYKYVTKNVCTGDNDAVGWLWWCQQRSSRWHCRQVHRWRCHCRQCSAILTAEITEVVHNTLALCSTKCNNQQLSATHQSSATLLHVSQVIIIFMHCFCRQNQFLFLSNETTALHICWKNNEKGTLKFDVHVGTFLICQHHYQSLNSKNLTIICH